MPFELKRGKQAKNAIGRNFLADASIIIADMNDAQDLDIVFLHQRLIEAVEAFRSGANYWEKGSELTVKIQIVVKDSKGVIATVNKM